VRREADHVSTADAIHVASFRGALRNFLRASEEIAQSNGLTPRRHLLLLMIKGAPDGSERATIGELTERLALAQSTVTELVKRAEQAGLIERECLPGTAGSPTSISQARENGCSPASSKATRQNARSCARSSLASRTGRDHCSRGRERHR
jgi:DNA-binding transcriptional ArsR family regulator